MRITSKGRVAIPADIREQAGPSPHTEVAFDFDGQGVSLAPIAAERDEGRGARLVAHLRGRGWRPDDAVDK